MVPVVGVEIAGPVAGAALRTGRVVGLEVRVRGEVRVGLRVGLGELGGAEALEDHGCAFGQGDGPDDELARLVAAAQTVRVAGSEQPVEEGGEVLGELGGDVGVGAGPNAAVGGLGSRKSVRRGGF